MGSPCSKALLGWPPATVRWNRQPRAAAQTSSDASCLCTGAEHYMGRRVAAIGHEGVACQVVCATDGWCAHRTLTAGQEWPCRQQVCMVCLP